jgi:hypothetical protein
VGVADLARYALYSFVFLLAPGVVAYRALAARPGGLLQSLCIGGALGHALALAAFMLAAAAGARGAFLAYPALVLLPAGAVAWSRRGRSPGRKDAFDPAQIWALAAVAGCALALFAAGGISQAPLPEQKSSASLYPDLVWGISIAAEARHQWPVTTPQVAGEPLRYHTFVFLQMAAVNQVTGIELSVVALRLVPLGLLLLLILQLAYAGRQLSGRAWAGPLAAGAVLLVGDFDLAGGRPEIFLSTFFSGLFLSPTQLFGLVAFVPAIILIRDLLEGEEAAPGDLVVLGVLLFAAAGAKGSVLPVMLGGLVLFCLWGWRRGLARRALAPLGLTILALAGSYAFVYSGGANGGSTLDPLQSAIESFPGARFSGLAERSPLGALVAYPVATALTLICLMPVLAGLAWVVRRGRALTATHAWLLALLVTGVAAYLLLDLPGGSQLYFLWYGFAAGAFAAVAGLLMGWDAWRARGSPLPAPAVLAGVVGIAVLLGLDPDVGGRALEVVYVAIALGLGCVLVACMAGVLDGTGRHVGLALLAAGVLTAAGLLDGPLDRLPGLAERAFDGNRTLHDEANSEGPRGVTADLARGLRWVRQNTDESSVLAVNNHFLYPAGRDSRYFYYSALAERRVYLEAWGYTDRAIEIGIDRVRAGSYPYPGRLALNDAAFVAPSESSLRALRAAGVTHLVADRSNGPSPPPSRLLGAPAFENRALLVYSLSRGRPRARAPARIAQP